MPVLSRTRIPTRILRALEKVFEAEINGSVFQSKAKVYETLVQEGWLQHAEESIGAFTRFPVRIRGYTLTHAGCYAYCQSCAAEEENP